MRGARRRLAVAVLLCVGTAAPAAAREPMLGQVRSMAAAFLGDSAARPTPRALPRTAATPTIDLADVSRPYALEAKLRRYGRLPIDSLDVAVAGGVARVGDYGIGTDQTVTGPVLVLHGSASISGTLKGNLVTYDGDVILLRGARIEGDVTALRGAVTNDGATVTGQIRTLSARSAALAADRAAPPATASALAFRNVAGVSGVLLSLALLGVGTLLFARPNVQVISDTVRFSFGRALAVGLLGQVLAAPALGMLVVGLILSVAGILLLPFAVIAFALLAVVAVLGGSLGASHAMGEVLLRRRLAAGAKGTPTGLPALATGLVLPAVLWLAWAAFSWVPVASTLMFGAAALATWFIWTAGFGATLLSRAGARENFAGRLLPPESLTDEFLWATPQYGVPAVQRPEKAKTATHRGGGSTGD